jgi:hypothetical protein
VKETRVRAAFGASVLGALDCGAPFVQSRLEARAMKKDSTGVKLGIAFGFLIALLIGVGWFGLSRMGQVNAEVSRLFNQRWEKLQLARQAVFYSNSNYRIIMKLVLLQNKVKQEADLLTVEREENRQKVFAAQKKIETMIDSEEEKELLAKIDESRGPTGKTLQKLFDLLANFDGDCLGRRDRRVCNAQADGGNTRDRTRKNSHSQAQRGS